VGDFATILEGVLKERVQSHYSTKTLGDINRILDNLAGAISPQEKTKVFQEQILSKFCAVEQKWLARIILCDLKIGLKKEAVLDHFNATALGRYNECVSLRLVCEEDGITSELKGIKLFTCYSPMLAKGFPQSSFGQVDSVEEAMKGKPFLMDVKLDGERLSVHIGDEGEQVRMFTRRGNDYSNKYACLGEYIRASVMAAGGAGTRCILDGEALAWDDNVQCYVPFGNNLGVGKAEQEQWYSALLSSGRGTSSTSSANSSSSSSARPVPPRAPEGWDRNLKQWLMFVVFDIVFLEGPRAKHVIQGALEKCNKLGQTIHTGTHLPLSPCVPL
jgi:DNA ligase-4